MMDFHSMMFLLGQLVHYVVYHSDFSFSEGDSGTTLDF